MICICVGYEGHPVGVTVGCDRRPVAEREFAEFSPVVITKGSTGGPVLLVKLAPSLALQHGAGVETTRRLETAPTGEVVVAAALVFLGKQYISGSSLKFYLPCILPSFATVGQLLLPTSI